MAMDRRGFLGLVAALSAGRPVPAAPGGSHVLPRATTPAVVSPRADDPIYLRNVSDVKWSCNDLNVTNHWDGYKYMAPIGVGDVVIRFDLASNDIPGIFQALESMTIRTFIASTGETAITFRGYCASFAPAIHADGRTTGEISITGVY